MYLSAMALTLLSVFVCRKAFSRPTQAKPDYQSEIFDTILPSVTAAENNKDSSELPRNKPVTVLPHAMASGEACRDTVTIANETSPVFAH